MIRNLLATTAMAALLTTGAYAQDTTAPSGSAAPAPMETTPSTLQATTPADGYLASHIIGQKIYNGSAEGSENIGKVNDIVLNADGKVDELVVGVGGFLGIGEKDVAVAFSDASWTAKDGGNWLVIATTKEQLEALPTFDRRAYEAAPGVAATEPVAPAPDQMAQNAPVPATPDAMAPDQTKTSAIDKSTLKAMPSGDVRAEELVGTVVYGADDANVGEIGDLVLTADGKIDAYIIDVGGFLGMGEKKVAVGGDNLVFMIDSNGKKYLYTTFTKDQLNAHPAFDESTYASQRDQQRMITTQ